MADRVTPVVLRAGNKLLDVLPPKAASQAWKMFQGSHLALFRSSGGRLGAKFGGLEVLFLHHVGRRSGTKRVSKPESGMNVRKFVAGIVAVLTLGSAALADYAVTGSKSDFEPRTALFSSATPFDPGPSI